MELYIREITGELWEVRDGSTDRLMAKACDERLANAIVALLQKTRIIVDITGGCLQTLMVDPRFEPFIDGYLADFDTEGSEDDGENTFHFLDSGDRNCLVTVQLLSFDSGDGTTDCELAVDAYLDESKRAKTPIYEYEISARVLWSDGTWESHSVLVETEDVMETQAVSVKGLRKIKEQANATNKLLRQLTSVTDAIVSGPKEVGADDEAEEGGGLEKSEITAPPLSVGDRVMTTLGDTIGDWTEVLKKRRKDNAYGEVLRKHDSDGECYTVRHPDGTLAGYERHELTLIPEDIPGNGSSESTSGSES